MGQSCGFRRAVFSANHGPLARSALIPTWRAFEIGQRLPNAAPIEPILAVAAGVEVVVGQGGNEPGHEHVVGRPVPGALDTHAEFVRGPAPMSSPSSRSKDGEAA